MSYWKDKVALITGGSAGLGFALAERLAHEGARVAIAARGEEPLGRAAAALSRSGGEVLPVAADMTQDADVERLLSAVIERFGRLDLLANCAGRSARGEVLSATPDEFRQLIELNLLGTVRMTARQRLICSSRVDTWLTSARWPPRARRVTWERIRPASLRSRPTRSSFALSWARGG